MNEDTKYPIKLKRVGGTNGELTVQFEVAPGSAYQKHFDADGNMTVTFKDGQEEAEAFVTTKRVKEKKVTFIFCLFKRSDRRCSSGIHYKSKDYDCRYRIL